MATAPYKPRNNAPAPALNKLLSGISYEDYARCEGINQSGLTKILKSPHYYQHCLSEPDKDSLALFEGRMVHLCVLEPEVYAARAAVAKIPKTGARRQEMLKEAAVEGIELVTEDQHQVFQRMRDAVWSNKEAYRLLASGVREGSIWWDEPAYRVRCKARLDFVSYADATPVVLDLKTALAADRDAFARAIVNGRYDLQVYHYLRAGEQSGAFAAEKFYFIAVEKSPPYYCTVYECGASVMGDGMVWWEDAMESYSLGYHKNVWPRPPLIETIEIPKWARPPGKEQ